MEKVLLANRPKLSPGSLRTYTSIINNLSKQIGVPLESPDDVIENHKKIMDHLREVPGKVRKTRLAALIVFIEKAKGADKVVDAFRKIMVDDCKDYEKELNKQEILSLKLLIFLSMKVLDSTFIMTYQKVIHLLRRRVLLMYIIMNI